MIEREREREYVRGRESEAGKFLLTLITGEEKRKLKIKRRRREGDGGRERERGIAAGVWRLFSLTLSNAFLRASLSHYPELLLKPLEKRKESLRHFKLRRFSLFILTHTDTGTETRTHSLDFTGFASVNDTHTLRWRQRMERRDRGRLREKGFDLAFKLSFKGQCIACLCVWVQQERRESPCLRV